MNERYVYFVVNRRNGHIKIGYSKNIEQRMENIRPVVSGAGLTVVGVVNGWKKEERFLHNVFKEYRVGNTEWFAPAPPLVEFIKESAKPYEGQTVFRDTDIYYGKSPAPWGYKLHSYTVPIYENPFQ